MNDRAMEVLLVETDAHLAGILARHIEEIDGVHVTCVESIADACCEELSTQHHVILTAKSLPDGDGIDLMTKIRSGNGCPVVILAEDLSADEVIEALRAGVADVLRKPIDLAYLADVIEKLIEVERDRRNNALRQARLRNVTKRIVSERRELRQQMDLICKDIVHAYRRLAKEVGDSGALAGRSE
jgi:DNA-binding NtrC family response regulator